jgi:hypothetical protein
VSAPLLIEPHYLGSIEYYTLIQQFDKIIFEINDHFVKQTYRNRCVFLGSNGTLTLSIPVKFGNRTKFKDVKIDYSQKWLTDHKKAFESAYGKAAYFDFFGEMFLEVWNKKHPFLLDLNMEMMSLCLKLLQIDRQIDYTEEFEKTPDILVEDYRNVVLAKESFENREIYNPQNYFQVFGADFVPNLSLVDLLMNCGLESREILKSSDKNHKEQF